VCDHQGFFWGRVRIRTARLNEADVHIRPATRKDIAGIVQVSNSSTLPGEEIGFGGGTGSPFHEVSRLASVWKDPNLVKGEEVLVAELNGRIVGCVTMQERGSELELVNIDVPLELQGRGIGAQIDRSVEEKARKLGKRAVTLGTSRNAEGMAWKSLPWWQHLGYVITHEEENEWTRSIGLGVREIRMRKGLD
jgi:predicted N-acetyltransferase YhbS